MQAPHIVEQPAPLAVEDRPPARILIVEDDASIAEVLSVRLKRQGFETTIALNGRDALAAATTDFPDLILMDLRLPDIDGLTICDQLGDSPDTAVIPVIVLSGMERPDIIRRSRAAGCQFFVRKPYDPNALLILIQHALDETSQWRVK
jgi:putative two-component system response regulator